MEITIYWGEMFMALLYYSSTKPFIYHPSAEVAYPYDYFHERFTVFPLITVIWVGYSVIEFRRGN